MDQRLKEIAARTKAKFGLANYYLKRHGLHRHVTIFNETVYTFAMEWFPKDVEEPEDGSNPDGTAVIEIKIPSEQVGSAIFVMGKSNAENGIQFTESRTENIIQWVEQETGLIYERQFELQKEKENSLLFKEVVDGIAVSPSGSIEVKWDEKGNLTFFSVDGHFPPKEWVKEETYTLSFEKVEQVAKDQLRLIEIPSSEEEKMIPLYGVEEIYLTNDEMTKIPFEFIVDTRDFTPIDQPIEFDQTTLTLPFEEQELSETEEITAEQAFSSEPSPDIQPITKAEQEQCITAVKELLSQEYPDESGNWILKTLHRDTGYIYATLRLNQQENAIFKRKLTVFIDPTSFQAINYIDNQPFLDIFNSYQKPEEVTMKKEAAYEKLKELYELTPYYVYDFEQKNYILCGKIDCAYGVDASSGKVIALEDV